MTSDTLDIHGPIPLTPAGAQVKPAGGVLDVCFVQLGRSSTPGTCRA